MSSPDSPKTRIHHRTCSLCEATCGLTLSIRGDDVVRIAGDDDDVFSRGFICPKGASLHHLHRDADRLRAPLIRRGDDADTATWEEVTWDEAFAEIERRLVPILTEHGRDAVAAYLGNPNSHNSGNLLYGRPLLRALGTRNVFTASTVDQMPKHVASGLLFGDSGAIAVPDLDRTDFLLMLGANPWESNGSLCTAPDFPGRLKALRARGGRFVVVDPRRTRTAEHADEHLPIRPASDAQLLLAMIHVVLSEGLASLGRAEPFVAGLEALPELVRPFTPAAVASVTGIAPDTIVRLARELATTERAVVYGRLGTHTVAFGSVAAWAVDVLNTITGHLDTEGGAMWSLPAHAARRDVEKGRGFSIGRHKSRVRGYPEVRGELPAATLADEILTPGQGQVRALLTIAGNPVLSTPDSARLDRALRTLDCVVSVDPYRNETTRHAHVILPPPSPLERSHYDMTFYGYAIRNTAKWSEPAFPRSGPSEADILARLALIVAGKGATADLASYHRDIERTTLSRSVADDPALSAQPLEALLAQLEADEPTDRLLEIMIRVGVYGDRFGTVPDGLTLAKLRAHPHGIDLGALTPRLPSILRTPSGKVELAPALIVQDLPRVVATLDAPQSDTLLLIGRRDLRSNNSWMHNLSPLVKGPERCTLQVHPDDAAQRGLAAGSSAVIAGRVGRVVARVELTDTIMRGVVSLPHGWGHAVRGARMQVAAARPGVNSNELTDAEQLDPLSGNAVLNGIPVTLQPA